MHRVQVLFIGRKLPPLLYGTLHTKIPRAKRPTTRDYQGPNTLSAGLADQRL